MPTNVKSSAEGYGPNWYNTTILYSEHAIQRHRCFHAMSAVYRYRNKRSVGETKVIGRKANLFGNFNCVPFFVV